MFWRGKLATQMSTDNEEKDGKIHNVNKVTRGGTPVGSAKENAPGNDLADNGASGKPVWKIPANDIITPEERWNMIAVAAYYRAEQRGFVGGSPAEDWIVAEKEIDSLLGGNKR
uniref:DUF2934 domain-containing protein n=1 Tax=Candidatus Kentrum sp. FM TaxID=2126340 RepID=A0A450S7X0_9GAMM|nr:MAG: Protein of unknown function (DUF2934) [Candidatus Kentron sp. FM]VFJ48002.1 MAG: Protein of unknown function (DUF2934) [Candidatus Kentron sp. FM]VFK07676.1 MAG: Protein of unknown function (DUF2934) [Candidatus Kentron sp. FM]